MRHWGSFTVAGRTYRFADPRLVIGADAYARLPYVCRVLAENCLRHLGTAGIDEALIRSLCDPAVAPDQISVPLAVPRVIVPDSSGVPVLLDLAALRETVARAGRDPERIEPRVPIDFVVDHSLQVDAHARPDAEAVNLGIEFQRNGERYSFIKWAESAFGNVRVHPPGSGIIHQVHLEQIARVTLTRERDGATIAFPDFALGGDSHTPMVNALGVLAWGVGGIEIETAALGQPVILPKPETVGVRLIGALREGITVTDAVLTLTGRLRKEGVTAAFVEFFGPAAERLSVPDRATLSNMAPEYGATTGFWPVDAATLDYLATTGRDPAHIALVKAHARAAGLYREAGAAEPDYDRVVTFDLGEIQRTLAGPSKPYVLQTPATLPASFAARIKPRETGVDPDEIPDGAVAIAAITSCTNTSNPHALLRAGLVAAAARERGLVPLPWVKTSLAPGSRAVTQYLKAAGLMEPLEALGFHVIGYGCTTCAGKSGPLVPAVQEAVEQRGISVAAVLSGNRNFDGRVHRRVAAAYLAAPALVVAYALAGRVTLDIEKDEIGRDRRGNAVRLADLWPTDAEVDALARRVLSPDVFRMAARKDRPEVATWTTIAAATGARFPWDLTSQYIVEPPFFESSDVPFATHDDISGARILGIYADGFSTDHISPSSELPAESEAGRYLIAAGVAPKNFVNYLSRRGNHHVMVRGTYAHPRAVNQMAPDREGGFTRLYPEDRITSVFEASEHYRRQNTPLVVLGGRDFGIGSSRDWAAKGPALLGVNAVIARSIERIHRSNLIGVGIVPLVFDDGDSVESLGLTGAEVLAFDGLQRGIRERGAIGVTVQGTAERRFTVRADVRAEAEVELLMLGGMFRAAAEEQLRAH